MARRPKTPRARRGPKRMARDVRKAAFEAVVHRMP
jgi:hypothetical protein